MLLAPLLGSFLGCPPPEDSAGACAPEIETFAAEGAPITLETGAVGLIRAYPISLPGSGTLKLRITGPVEVVDAAGSVLTEVDAPAEVYLRATGSGVGQIIVSAGRGCATKIEVRGVTPAPLVGRPRWYSPFWQSATSFWAGESVDLGLDPARFPDRVGIPFDAYVVAHRSTETWASDAALVGLAGTPVEGTLEAGILAPMELAVLDAGDDALGEYDIVIDQDRDGLLGPGDLIQGLGSAGITVLGDLTQPGPHAVETDDVSGGWFLGERVWWPADLAALGPRPLVVISHGNGHEYIWYDYLGEHLASWGYVVMAHQNNTEPGIETASTTTLTNTDWLLGHLEEPGGGALVGLVDSTRIGWIGHSRGGEGIVRALDRLVDGDFVPDNFGADNIRYLASIAPTVFNPLDDSDPHDRPYLLLAGTADGDVTGGVESPIVQFFRIWEKGTGPKAAAYVHGASHNDFNCCAAQEGQGPSLIGRDEAQVVARAYMLAVARAWLDGDDALLDVFRNEYAGFVPLSFASADIVATSWRNAATAGDGVLDDFQTEHDADVSSSGTVVTCTADMLLEDQLRDRDKVLAWSEDDPMNAMTHNGLPGDEAWGAVFSWSESSAPFWAVEVPESLSDSTPWTTISFSVAQRSRHPETDNWGGAMAFGVTLVDQDGVESTVDFADQALVPFPYARLGNGTGRGWANEFVTVRINLADFTVGSEIDLAQLAEVRLDFGEAHGAPSGAVGLDSVEFAR
ncbi:hypothetical protein LBMAG42_17660 [Deltaproteobacteria bacterium]|nr:hypothetical protein LBMAG42_17660 [Deltaproteobacteria bacterium]